MNHTELRIPSSDLDAFKNESSYAGFWRRSGAYCVDIIPIVLLVTAIAYQFGGLDSVLSAYLRDSSNWETRIQFTIMQKTISEASFLIYILYASFMESSRYQATFGKLLFHMKVINAIGGRPTFKNALGRNWSKIFSWLVVCLGFVAVAFSKTKQGWHDKIAKTYVVVNA